MITIAPIYPNTKKHVYCAFIGYQSFSHSALVQRREFFVLHSRTPVVRQQASRRISNVTRCRSEINIIAGRSIQSNNNANIGGDNTQYLCCNPRDSCRQRDGKRIRNKKKERLIQSLKNLATDSNWIQDKSLRCTFRMGVVVGASWSAIYFYFLFSSCLRHSNQAFLLPLYMLVKNCTYNWYICDVS